MHETASRSPVFLHVMCKPQARRSHPTQWTLHMKLAGVVSTIFMSNSDDEPLCIDIHTS